MRLNQTSPGTEKARAHESSRTPPTGSLQAPNRSSPRPPDKPPMTKRIFHPRAGRAPQLAWLVTGRMKKRRKKYWSGCVQRIASTGSSSIQYRSGKAGGHGNGSLCLAGYLCPDQVLRRGATPQISDTRRNSRSRAAKRNSTIHTPYITMR